MAADSSALSGGRLVGLLATAGTALFSAAGHFIYGRPRASLGFFGAQAARFVAFFYVFGLAFLFAGITGFITLWHNRNFVCLNL